MALLGMLAAGAAMGARDASNNSVRALNEMELARARNGMEMDREALRMKYEERRYQQQREDAKEAGKAKMQLEEARYQRTRADKLVDRESENKLKLQIEGMKEKGRNDRFGQRQSLLRENAKKSSGGAEGFNPRSPEGKAAQDLIEAGLAKDWAEAYDMVQQDRLMRGVAGNNFMTDPKQVFELQRKYRTEQSNNTSPQNPQEAISFIRDPKTGKLMPQ